jgi:hypothetical protein
VSRTRRATHLWPAPGAEDHNRGFVDRPDLPEGFYQEAPSAGKLQHPNIVTILILSKRGTLRFIAMEHRDRESLEKTIPRQTELPFVPKVGYIVRICQVLECTGGRHSW